MSTTTSDLFSPFSLGPFTLSNRIVLAPMTRSRAGENNVPTALNAAYYAQRASAGLIIAEATQVSPEGVGYPNTPGIHTDAQVEGWRRVTDAVHADDGLIFLQLWHVGRVSHPSMQPSGQLPVAPSAIAPAGEIFTANGLQPFVTPRALDLGEIPGVVRQYAEGARRAKAAGFDGVEVHGANGYLIDQFLRDGSNQRTDAYGGSVANRVRFLLEVTQAVVDAWDGGHVGVRLSPLGAFNDMRDGDPWATFGHAAEALNRFGLAYLHVIEALPGHPMGVPDVQAPRITPHLREVFRGPLMANGGYDHHTGNDLLARGEADLVAYGVPFLANPDLPERYARNAPLNEPDQSTFYGGDARGYTDYPTLTETLAAV